MRGEAAVSGCIFYVHEIKAFSRFVDNEELFRLAQQFVHAVGFGASVQRAPLYEGPGESGEKASNPVRIGGTVEAMDGRYEPTWTYLRRVPTVRTGFGD